MLRWATSRLSNQTTWQGDSRRERQLSGLRETFARQRVTDRGQRCHAARPDPPVRQDRQRCRSVSNGRSRIDRPLLGLRNVFVETVLAEADVELRAGQSQCFGSRGFVEMGVVQRFRDEDPFDGFEIARHID